MDLTFQKRCETVSLTTAIVTAGLPQGSRFYGVTCSDDGVTTVHLPDDSTDDEQAIATTAVNNYSSLQAVQLEMISRLNAECTSYIYRHYGPPQQTSLTALMVEGVALGYTNRVGLVGSALGWVKSVINYFYTIQDQINATTAADAVSAVTWDFAGQFDSTDPLVTIRQAQSMTN